MKKVIGATLVAMALASGVMADGYIKGGVYTSESDSTSLYFADGSEIGYELAVGGNGHFDSTGGLLLGGEIQYSIQNSDLATTSTTKNMSTVGGQVHLGWTFFDDLDIYGIGGYYATAMDMTFNDGSYDTVTGAGIRFGAGIDYTIWEHLSVGAEYTTTTYDLEWASTTASTKAQTYTNFGGNIKLRF